MNANVRDITFQRRLRGQCQRCGKPNAPSRLSCARCLEKMRAWAQCARDSQAGLPHHAIACCGQWHAIETMPFLAPCCGRRMLGESNDAP